MWGKATLYFLNHVIFKRNYLKPEWIEQARCGEGVKFQVEIKPLSSLK